MANTRRECGLRPINQPYGAIRCTWYQARTGVAFYRFQPVDKDSNGMLVAASAGSGNLIVGSVIATGNSDFGPPESTASGYMPAYPTHDANSAGLINICVADDPNQFFVIQEGTDVALAQTNVGNVSDFVVHATVGNDATGIAGIYLSGSGCVAAGSNQQLRLVKKWDKPDNEFGNYCKWIVTIYQHRYGTIVGVADEIGTSV